MSDLNHEITVWITKAMGQFLPKPMPVDLNTNNPLTDASDLLAEKARLLMEVHEARSFDGREPFTLDDYQAFQEAHKELAEGHKNVAETLKSDNPDALQAISAHGDAMALHNDASKLAEMMQPSDELGERNKMWPQMESNSFRFGRTAPWDTEEKNWRKAHQAFIASQLAAQKTAFDLGVVKKGGPNIERLPTKGDWRGMETRFAQERKMTPEQHEQAGDDHVSAAKYFEGRGEGRQAELHLQEASRRYGLAGKTEKKAEAERLIGARTVGDFPGHPFRGNQYTKSVDGAEIQKGDTPGHPFRGNQWQQLAGQHMKTGADLRDQAAAALSPENVAWDGEASKAQQRANIAAGNKIAKAGEAHLNAAIAMLDASGKPTAANVNRAISMSAKAEALSPLSLSHAQIADAHADEAKSWAERAQGHAAEGKFVLANLAQNAADAHNAAAAAHEAVLDHSEFSRERGAVRSAEYKTEDAGRIYDRAVKADKEAETSWNGGATQKSAEIQKGDLPGHAFRGNQYASLGEKASDLAAAVKKLNSRSTPDEIRSLAKVHEQVAKQHFTVSLQSAEMRHLTDPSEIGQKTYDNLVSTSAIEGDKHSDAGYRHSDTADKLYYAAELKEQGSPSAASSILANAKISSANAADASKEAASSGVHWPVGDPEFAQHEEAVLVGKSVDFTKGDVVGHVFHGNQYKGGTSSVPSDVGHRDFDPNTTLSQIGKMNVLAVSGGKVNTVHDTDGKAIGLELPVSSGYKVRVFLRDDDTYTVQRVHKDSVKGEEKGVFADQVGESVYQAGMYKSNPFGGHSPR